VPRWKDSPDTRLPQVAIGGRSNVGKSSLLNAMLGRRGLARTSSTPGRTRAMNLFLVEERFLLVDLPGYGYAKAPLSEVRAWVANTRDYISRAQTLRGILLLLDIRREPSQEDQAFYRLVSSSGLSVLPVVTKADKVGRGRRRERRDAIAEGLDVEPADLVLTSSKTGEGFGEVWGRVLEWVRAEERGAGVGRLAGEVPEREGRE
jgi:GTP-binding protein